MTSFRSCHGKQQTDVRPTKEVGSTCRNVIADMTGNPAGIGIWGLLGSDDDLDVIWTQIESGLRTGTHKCAQWGYEEITTIGYVMIPEELGGILMDLVNLPYG